jgi:hypothetical protein
LSEEVEWYLWRKRMKPLSSKKIQHFPDWESQPINGETFSPFWPVVYLGKIHDEFIDELNTHITNLNASGDATDVKGQLAGRVEKQLFLQDLISDKLEGHIRQHIVNFTNQQNMGMEDHHIVSEGVWCNCASARDFNPRHQHTGNFSYVIYTKNTVDPTDVANNPYDNAHGDEPSIAGNIELYYGEMLFMNQSRFMHIPAEGDILVFPAWLQHSVYPFYCDGERWSVAGNYRFATYEELNPPQ